MAITGSYCGLYSSDGTTLTRLGVNSTNTTSGLWDSDYTLYAQTISSSAITLDPSVEYYVGLLVNASTGGAHCGHVKVSNQPAWVDTYGPVPMYTLATQTSLPTTKAISALTKAYDLIPFVGLC